MYHVDLCVLLMNSVIKEKKCQINFHGKFIIYMYVYFHILFLFLQIPICRYWRHMLKDLNWKMVSPISYQYVMLMKTHFIS